MKSWIGDQFRDQIRALLDEAEGRRQTQPWTPSCLRCEGLFDRNSGIGRFDNGAEMLAFFRRRPGREWSSRGIDIHRCLGRWCSPATVCA